MDITQQEAQSSLETIEAIQRQTRRALAHGGGPFFMIIWGAVWLVGYLASYFLNDRAAGTVWMVADAAGIAASFLTGWWMSRQVRMPGHDARIAIFWLLWLVYAALIVWLTESYANPDLTGVLIAVFAMFGYVVMGLWLWRPLIWVGIGVTILALAIYLLIPDYADLAMAILGGGALIGSGVYIYRNWR